MKFSLMFFASSEDDSVQEKYDLIIQSAKYADKNGFSSIWIPERHFTKFGYLYPSPAVLHAALARETSQIKLMAGSVVMPLHNPIRVVEDWSVVDNLSNGRIGISFASGWNPNDFAFFPEKYKTRQEEMYEGIRAVQKLWKGESLNTLNGVGKQVELEIYPKPLQKQLPLWITSGGNPESFRKAGELGANLLTHILDQDLDQLEKKIVLYKEGRTKGGFEGAGEITVMIHTFLGADASVTREQARKPFCDYLKANKSLLAGLAESRGTQLDTVMSGEDIDELVNLLYDRFSSTRGFIGTPDTSHTLLKALEKIGVTEVACLLDFGPHPDLIIQNLPYINRLKERGSSTSSESNLSKSTRIVNDNSVRIFKEDKIQKIKARCKNEITKEAFYDKLNKLGVEVPQAFQGVEQVLVGTTEVLALIDIFSFAEDGKKESLHNDPRFIDSCSQILYSILPENALYISIGFESCVVLNEIKGAVYCHGSVAVSSWQNAEEALGDLTIYDEFSQPALEIRGLKLKRISTISHPESKPLVKQNNSPVTYKKTDEIILQLKTIVGSLLNIPSEKVQADLPFIEMGADSIILVNTIRKIEKEFQIKLSIRQFFEELKTIHSLAEFISKNSTKEFPGPVVESPVEQSNNVQGLIQQSKNLDQSPIKLDGAPVEIKEVLNQVEILKKSLELQLQTLSQSEAFFKHMSTSGLKNFSLKKEKPGRETIPVKEVKLCEEREFTTQQSEFLSQLIRRYNSKTRKSKEYAQEYRTVLNDWLNSLDFRLSIKELQYPIVSSASSGSRLWDIDGNEYVDIATGFGANLFGNSPAFIKQAISNQLEKGFEIATQSKLAGEVAALISELTGAERVVFSNTGTESVMTAIRIARATSGKNKLVVFNGFYHGTFDGILAHSINENGETASLPLSPGTPDGMVEDVLVLDYDSADSLKIISERAHEIGGVLIEPVQSRRPGSFPVEFLLQLRRVTEDLNIPLIFDEIITGFRVHQGGIQGLLGIQADITTYGKVLGGGMPLGVITGKSKYLDCIDGGFWKYGDLSYPESKMIFFGGTFCKHPLALAACKAVLEEIKKEGPELQESLNNKTKQFAEDLNKYFDEINLPIRIDYFGSLFRFESFGNYSLLLQPIEMKLFFYILLEKGVYTWERKQCFFSVSHTQADIDIIKQKVKETIEEMVEGGFFPEYRVGENNKPLINTVLNSQETDKGISENYIKRIPLTSSQKAMWVMGEIDPSGSLAYHVIVSIRFKGKLNLSILKESIQKLVERHDSLRSVIDKYGECQLVAPKTEINLAITEADNEKIDYNEWIKEVGQRPFNLVQGPLIRANLLKITDEDCILTFTVHHIIFDGTSIKIFSDELGELYSAEIENRNIELDAPMQFDQYITRMQEPEIINEVMKSEEYWLNKYSTVPPVLNLPVDFPRPTIKTYNGGRKYIKIGNELYDKIKAFSREKDCTVFMTLLSSYSLLIHRLSSTKDIVIGIPIVVRPFEESYNMIGCTANMLPVRSTIDDRISLKDYLQSIKKELLYGYENQLCTYNDIIDKLNLTRDLSRSPLVELGFNLNPKANLPNFKDLKVDYLSSPIAYSAYDLLFDISEIDREFHIDCDYNSDLFKGDSIHQILKDYISLIEEVIQGEDYIPNLFRGSNGSFSTTKTYSFDEVSKMSLVEESWEKLNETNRDYNNYFNKLYQKVSPINLPKDFLLTNKETKYEYIGRPVVNGLDGLRHICKLSESSLIGASIAVLKILFSKYANTNEVSIGMPVTRKLDSQMLDLLVPISSKVVAEDSFSQHLESIDQSIEELASVVLTRNHGSFGISTEQEKFWPDVVVAFEDAFLENFENENIRYYSENIYNNFIAKRADLFILFKLIDGQRRVQITYNSKAFRAERIERMFIHFEALITSIKRDISQSISSLNILSNEETLHLSQSLERSQKPYPSEKTIQEMVEDIALKYPDSIALSFGNVKLTYKELNKKANQLAHYLRSTCAIKPDDLIGIMVDRSEKLIISILGVLKSGAAYVPIDTEYPQQRKSYIFQDSKIRVLITESDKLFTISDYEGELFAIDVQMEDLDTSAENPVLINTSKDVAYVIYTSGSTGKPKGVMVEHSGSVNMILSQLSILGIGKSDRILQFASASFDASVYEIFMALYSGAALVMADNERIKDPSRFSEMLKAEGVTVATLPPSFVNVLPKNTFCGLRVLITAGEAANVSDAIGLSRHLKYVNAYGPTECSVCVSTHNVTGSDGQYGSIPIGDSIDNTGVYLFNSALQFVPIGVDGELYVSGAGLARGYINQPELTKEKFIEHPFKKGERLYKTGDLCRWTEEGELLYKGRVDRQLKIRGHRIEAQEIETVLEEIEEVDEALVESIRGSADDTVLVAYLVGQDIKVEGMKKRLLNVLPSFMVPDYFVALKTFPLTTQGKVDRKQLPIPQEIVSNNGEVIAPLSKIEKALAKIWGKILGKHAIGVEDNFFDIGGQSLKAIQIVFEIQKILNIKIELKTLFTNPTIKSLAEVLSRSESGIYKPIPAIPYQENYPLSYAQKRLWVLNKFDKQNAVFNIPIACKIQGVLDVKAFNTAFRLLIQRHEILRTGIVELNGEARQKILRPEDVIFNFDAEKVTGDNKDSRIKEIAKEEADFVFSLEQAPLFRARLLKISDSEFVFLFTMHHIISDGWSNNILIAELFDFYKASKDNEPILLPPLTIQYKDYSVWHNTVLDDSGSDAYKNYWLEVLKDNLPQIDMPTDFPRPKIRSYKGKRISWKLDVNSTTALESFNRNNNTSAFITLLAIVNTILYRYTAQKDIVVGTTITGRDHPDLENQIGFYINTLPLRTRFKDAVTFRDVFEKVQTTVLDAYDHQLYPFDKMVADLKIPRDLSRSPLFDVLVEFITGAIVEKEIRLESLSIIPYDQDIDISKYDLAFRFYEEKESLFITLEYSTELYQKETIETLKSRFIKVIEEVLANPDLKIDDIPLSAHKAEELQTTMNVEESFNTFF